MFMQAVFAEQVIAMCAPFIFFEPYFLMADIALGMVPQSKNPTG